MKRSAIFLSAALLLAGTALVSTGALLPAQETPAATLARRIGAIKSIAGNSLTLTPDSGPDVSVTVQPDARILRIAPGTKDLKDATTVALHDLQVGDRVRVRGHAAREPNSMTAAEIIVMSRTDLEARRVQEQQDWQKHGVGGLVDSVDPATGVIHISVPRLGGKKEIAIRASKNTVVRRYSADSARPENAKPSSVSEIRSGDQVRARGNHNADGTEVDAEEIYAGFFPQFAATVKSVDTTTGLLTLEDIRAKKTVEVKITPESQLHKIPPEMAQGFATFLKGMTAQAIGGAPTSTVNAGPGGVQTAAPANGPNGHSSRVVPGMNGRAPDLQGIIARVPSSSLSDLNLHKGDTLLVLATEGSPSTPKTAIKLLSGVEPILRAAPSASDAMMLSPWTLGGAPGGEGAQ